MKTNIVRQYYIFLIGTLLIVSFIFLPTVNRDWQIFDEKDVYYNEGLYPTPGSLSEIFEVISTYAFNSNVESQNLTFSNIINIRSNPVGTIFHITISYLLKKNPFYYHLLGVSVHLLNTLLIWLIFYKSLKIQNCTDYFSYALTSLFTLIWALHPANVESVLMGTNWLSLLTYSFCLGLFLYNLLKLSNKSFTNSLSEFISIFLLFIICISIGEYGYTLPFVIFFTSFAFSKSIRNSITLSIPYFSGILFYILFYFLRHFHSNNMPYQSINFSFERFLWLSPQIFIHFFKIFFYPKDLSIFQSNLVSLSSSHFEPYAIFSFFIFMFFLILPFIFSISLKSKTSSSFIFLLVYSFIFSVFPFLHILTPAYFVFAERYCYFPLFLFLFFISTFISLFQNKKILISLLLIILLPLSIRTVSRSADWKDSYSLYSSAMKTYKSPIYKGFGYAVLGYYFNGENNVNESNKYFLLSIKALKSAMNKLKKDRNKQAPETLKIYGLDTNTLILNAAFRIASIRFYDFHDKTSEILKFYMPYIESNINTAGSSQLDLYSKLLLKTNQPQKALEILKFAKEKYPFSTTIIFSFSNFYLNQKDLLNAEKIILEGLTYYPNYVRILPRTIKLYALKNDLINLAKYEYLLGLRTHSQEAYQKSLQIYLAINKLNDAKKIINKLLLIDKNNPVTLLLAEKYYLLTHNEK